MRNRLACLALALLLPHAAAAGEAEQENSLGMSFIDTPDAQLIWFEPLDYLAPHVIRTYTNSLGWQRRMLGWQPSERTTLLLKDQSDYGTVAAGTMPRNRLTFDVAPISQPVCFPVAPAANSKNARSSRRMLFSLTEVV